MLRNRVRRSVGWSSVFAFVCLGLALPEIGGRIAGAAENSGEDALIALFRGIEVRTSRASALADAGSYEEAVPLWLDAAGLIEEFEAGLSTADRERYSLFKPMSLIRYAAGSCLNELGRHREAVEELGKAKVCVRRYADGEPGDRANWSFLVTVHTSLVVAFTELGEYGQADAEREALGKACEEALLHHPGDKDFIAILEAVAASLAGS